MTELERFAEVLRRTHEDSGLTQREFAADLGISHASLNEYMQGQHSTGVRRAIRMLLALEERFAVRLRDLV